MNRHAPWPSCQITFKRSPRRPRKQNRWPLKGSRRKTSWTCKRQRREAPAHVGVPGRQPHPHAGRNRDHGLPPIDNIENALQGAHVGAGPNPHAPPVQKLDLDAIIGGEASLSLRSQPVSPLFAGAVRETGRNAGAGSGFASFRATFRQRNRRFGVIPCRRATADTFTPGRKASAMIACFSSSLQRRRVSATTEYRWAKLSPDIGTGIVPVVTTVTNKTCILARPQGGLHRRITVYISFRSMHFRSVVRHSVLPVFVSTPWCSRLRVTCFNPTCPLAYAENTYWTMAASL